MMHLLWLVGLALYAGIIGLIGWRPVRDAFTSVDPRALMVMAGVLLLAKWIRVLKWRFALGPGRQAVGLFFVSKLGGAWTPMRVGELSPLLLRSSRSARMGAWIVLDRLLETSATLALGAFGLLLLGLGSHELLPLIVAGGAVLVGLPAVVLMRRDLLVLAAGRSRRQTRLRRLLRFAAEASKEARRMRRMLPVVSMLTFVSTALDAYAGVVLIRSFGFDLEWAVAAAAQCAHGITSAIPITPSATGVPYVAAAGLIVKLGGIPVDVAAAAPPIAMVVNGIVFWPSFGIGLWSFRGRRPVQTDQAALFDRLVSSSNQLYAFPQESLERLNALVPKKGVLLDVGCGEGTIAAALDADRIVGLEVSSKCARLAGAQGGVRAPGGIAAVVGDAVAGLPFGQSAFDTVYCINVLHHLGQAWDAIFEELDRVLRGGGTLAIVEPDARNPLIRWTQAPGSPIRVAPCSDEPAIDPAELLPHLQRRGYEVECGPIGVEGHQIERSVFPMWQRFLKAPFVLALAWAYRGRPQKFVIVARKPHHSREKTRGCPGEPVQYGEGTKDGF